jgi:predicted amidohydrolase YtcJ
LIGWKSIGTLPVATPQIDADRGAFFENGLAVANRHFAKYTLQTERFRGGLDRMRSVIHAGGQTTIGDAAFGMYDFEGEWEHLRAVIDRPDTPFRMLLMPFAAALANTDGPDFLVETIRSFSDRNTHGLRFSDHVKMFSDGGFFAELMMLQAPGYLDGHNGEWLTVPEQFEAVARTLWNAGLHLHVHCTGDLGVELALSTLEKLQWQRPRFDHRFTFEHFGISNAQQVDRIARVGGLVSAQVYYVYELSRAFADNTLGYERASQMSRMGSVERAGIPFALHSDFTMAPAKPLNNARIAANRINESGEVMCPDERATLDGVMRAMTTNAAYILGMEDEVGSLRAGKKADFAILEDDPYDVGVEGLRDIGVWGTVFEGEPFERTSFESSPS